MPVRVRSFMKLISYFGLLVHATDVPTWLVRSQLSLTNHDKMYSGYLQPYYTSYEIVRQNLNQSSCCLIGVGGTTTDPTFSAGTITTGFH